MARFIGNIAEWIDLDHGILYIQFLQNVEIPACSYQDSAPDNTLHIFFERWNEERERERN